MAIGLGLLRLSPEAFWSMTPREFERAASVLVPAQAGDRWIGTELAGLMQAFPTDRLSEDNIAGRRRRFDPGGCGAVPGDAERIWKVCRTASARN